MTPKIAAVRVAAHHANYDNYRPRFESSAERLVLW